MSMHLSLAVRCDKCNQLIDLAEGEVVKAGGFKLAVGALRKKLSRINTTTWPKQEHICEKCRVGGG